MATLGPVPKAQFLDAAGQPLVGGKVWTYTAGTTTPLTTYTDSTGTTENTNPVILDSRGEAAIWFAESVLYKVMLTDADDVEIYTVDNLSGNITALNPSITDGTITDCAIENSVIGAVTPTSGNFTVFSGEWAQLPAGTTMLFVQSTAPTGWTKSVTHNNKALRVVSGTVGTGGSVAFTTAFSSQSISGTVDPHTLTIDEIPAHTHSYTVGGNTLVKSGTDSAFGASFSTSSTGSTGGAQGHSHTFSSTSINLAVQYVDVIIAVKD